MSKAGLIEKIEERFRLLDDDFKSFIWLRSEGKNFLDVKKLGGGNLLVLMGELSLLSFLIKVHAILVKGSEAFKEGSDREVNELDAFRRFIRSIDYPTGFDKDDENLTKRVWDGMRNSLFHMATLAENRSAQTYIFQGGTFEDAIDISSVLNPPFEVTDSGRVICNIDRLRRSLYSLWLPELKHVIESASTANVEMVLAWIDRIEQDPNLVPVADQSDAST